MHGEEELRRLGAGRFYGEAAILGDGRRTADVVAETDLELLAMFGTRFRVLQMEMPELGDDRGYDARAARPMRSASRARCLSAT
jgi:CRP-like cAMP-binding protein